MLVMFFFVLIAHMDLVTGQQRVLLINKIYFKSCFVLSF